MLESSSATQWYISESNLTFWALIFLNYKMGRECFSLNLVDLKETMTTEFLKLRKHCEY